MSEYDVYGEPRPINVAATGLEEILQNVRTILLTLQGSVPLDRGFARSGEAVDRPEPKAMAAEVSSLYEAIEEHEPRVIVTRIDFVQSETQSMEGKLVPRVRIRIRQGAL